MQFSVTKIASRLAPYLVSALAVVAAGGPTCVQACPCSEIPRPAAEAPAINRQEALNFINTAEYQREFDQAIAGARAACLKHKGEPNLAIVSDLDETLLDNSPLFRKQLDYSKGQFRQWIATSEAPPLKPTADLIAWARERGYAIFFVTGRREKERRATIENLLHDNISYDGLYMRGDKDDRPAEDVKAEYRQQIEGLGFKIIVSIGDQLSDLYGGHAEDCEKLPNKMYYIP